VTATEQYIGILTRLKSGELGLLRAHAGRGLDESVGGFDLFTSLWWPLRQKNERAPKREVAWLVAKLYACCPIEHSPGAALARQLGRCQPNKDPAKARFQNAFDRILILPLGQIEPSLRWALAQVASGGGRVDWARLTDDLWQWEHESTRLRWAEEFLGYSERG
jgi:CRISPR type I-E-associated protein CasB/Cse2